MRALAEFIMRGRLQAGTIAVIGNLVPFLTPIAVALVVLRKGIYEGAIVLFLGVLPILLALFLGRGDSFGLWLSLTYLMALYTSAWVLRVTVSLPYALLAMILCSALLGVFLGASIPESEIEGFNLELREVLASLNPEADNGTVSITRGFLSGGLASLLAVSCVFALFLGRWMQALLYNPGGFRKEFYSYRLPVGVALPLLLIAIMMLLQSQQYMWWAVLLTLPLIVVSAAVMHSTVKARNLGIGWLVLFYIMTPIAKEFVVLLGFLDSFVNFRRRLIKSDEE